MNENYKFHEPKNIIVEGYRDPGLMKVLLDNSCSNPDMDMQDYVDLIAENQRRRNATPPEPEKVWDGFNIFRIDLCCTAFKVIAKRHEDNSWEIKSMETTD